MMLAPASFSATPRLSEEGEMIRTRVIKPWFAAIVGTLVVVFGIAFGVHGFGVHSAKAAQPAASSVAQFQLRVNGLGTLKFTELEGVSSEVQPNQYLDTANGAIQHTKQFGKTKPPTLVLARPLRTDPQLWTWHMNAADGKAAAATYDAQLVAVGASGNVIMRWYLTNIWPSKISIGNMKAGSNTVTETVTFAADQIDGRIAG